MKITYLNNDGAGYASEIEVETGTTLEDFVADRIGRDNAVDYVIRVNRQQAIAGTILQPGDRVTLTPTKVTGGAR